MIDIAELCPVNYPDDPAKEIILRMGWSGALHWSVGKEEIRQAFEQETKHAPFVAVGSSPLERMIDKACGINEANETYLRDFILWFNVAIWGDPDAEETDS